jgi:hypothetical protein
LKNPLSIQNQQEPNAVILEDDEVLGPTPPEDHHHISKDVRDKVDVLKWLADNRQDPVLKVRPAFYSYNPDLKLA